MCLLVVGEGGGPKRRLGVQGVLRPPQRVDLRPGSALRALRRLVQRALDHPEIGQEQLAANVVELRDRPAIGAEAPEHEGQRVGLAERRQSLRARDPAGDVDEANLRVHGLLRPLHLGEDREPGIRTDTTATLD